MRLRLFSRLPRDRQQAGQFWMEDAPGNCVFGPVRCRGEADNSGAASHGNPQEDPTRLFGDHPFGTYRILAVRREMSPRTFGGIGLVLDPIVGEALIAKQNGRTGLLIHGGDLHPDGRLRETFGCLRVDNATIQMVALLVEGRLSAGELVEYECRPEDSPSA